MYLVILNPQALANIQQRNVMTILDETPTMEELMKAVASLADGKAPGGDVIPAEIWRHGGLGLILADCLN